MRFSLLHDPWIPLLGRRGVEEASLLEAFRRSGEVSLAASPYEYLPLLRFLLLLTHHALGGPKGLEDLLELDPDGLWKRVQAFLGPYEDRFYLPGGFLDAPLGEDRTPFSPAELRPDWPSGEGGALAEPRGGGRPLRLTPSEAARALLAEAAYYPGGLHAKDGYLRLPPGPLAQGIAFVPLGQNLFATLLLSLVDVPALPPLPWEAPSADPVGRYFHPRRRFALLFEGERLVGVRVGTGSTLPLLSPDPMLAYVAPGKPLEVRDPDRPLHRVILPAWRRVAPPLVLERAEEVHLALGLEYSVAAFAQATQRAAVRGFFYEGFPPLLGERGSAFLRVGEQAVRLGEALEAALGLLGEKRKAEDYWFGVGESFSLPEEEAKARLWAKATEVLERVLSEKVVRLGKKALRAEGLFRRLALGGKEGKT